MFTSPRKRLCSRFFRNTQTTYHWTVNSVCILRYPLERKKHTDSIALAKSVQDRRMTPTALRLSASLIVVNARNEVLMVQRNLDSRSFAGAHVFPGGNFDKAQDSSLDMTAIRETFEEAGVLLASQLPDSQTFELPDSAFDEARKAIHAGKLLFTDFLTKNGLAADSPSLIPFSSWITPQNIARRFQAQFFITFLPTASTLAGPSKGKHLHRLPTPDSPDSANSSTTEVISAQFIHPNSALSAFARGEIGLMPPQLYILTTLRDIFGFGVESESNTPAQRDQVRRFVDRGFGSMVFSPQPLAGLEKSPDGRQILVLEGDETRGGKKGRLHRTIFIPRKGTPLPEKMELIRNFDIFTHLEEILPSSRSKL